MTTSQQQLTPRPPAWAWVWVVGSTVRLDVTERLIASRRLDDEADQVRAWTSGLAAGAARDTR